MQIHSLATTATRAEYDMHTRMLTVANAFEGLSV